MNKQEEYEVNMIIKEAYEKLAHIREYLEVMKDEPDEYILLSRVYHDLMRILGEET